MYIYAITIFMPVDSTQILYPALLDPIPCLILYPTCLLDWSHHPSHLCKQKQSREGPSLLKGYHDHFKISWDVLFTWWEASGEIHYFERGDMIFDVDDTAPSAAATTPTPTI